MNATTFKYRQDQESGCWVWLGYHDKNGYGRIYDRDAKVIKWAHRYSYEQHKGEIPAKHEVDHVCQRINCVNPDHLDAVTKVEHARRTMERLGKDDLHCAAAHLRRIGATYAEIADALNYADRTSAAGAVNAAIAKGLIDPDEIPRVTHLTDDERVEIADLAALGIPQGVIAEMYGVHNSHISRVSRGVSSHAARAS